MNKTVIIPCKLCKYDKAEIIAEKLRFEVVKPVCKCLKCGFIYISPSFVEQDNLKYYETEYRQDYKAPEAKYFFESQLEESKLRLKRIENYLNKDMKILEIGCAAGSMLYILRQSGYNNIEGLELDRKYSEFVREHLNFTVYQKCLEESNISDSTYDTVLCFHVLEHLPDPIVFLKNIHRILKPGGLLICEVPNVKDYLLTVFRLKSYQQFYFQPAHNYYFSAVSLKEALNQAEYTKIVVRHIQRYSIFNGINWILKGKPSGLSGGVKRNFINSLINRIFSQLWILSGVSDTLLAFSKKNT